MEAASDDIVRWRCDDSNLEYARGMVDAHIALYEAKQAHAGVRGLAERFEDLEEYLDEKFEDVESAGKQEQELKEAFERKDELASKLLSEAKEKMEKIG